MLKIMEKVVDEYIKSKYLKKQPLSSFQFAYQSNKSTVSALHELVTKIEKNLAVKEIALAAFLDIEGAFDNAKHSSIRKAMTKKGFEPCIIGWIMAMLNNREVLVELGGSSITIKTTRGCPQGGVLSPLLWSLVVDDLLSELTTKGFDVIGFADDVVILVRGKFDNIVVERMQFALNHTLRWCKNENLNINPNKTTVVPFTRRRKITFQDLLLGKAILKYSSSVKYLGITMDSKLSWNLHIEQVTNKATSAFWLSRKTFGMKWGLKPKMIHWIYTAIIRPRLTYAALVWWPKTKVKSIQNKQEKLQRIICRSITGAMRSTPSKALEAALHILPLHQYVQMEAGKSALRLRRTASIPGNNLVEHLQILKHLNVNPQIFMTDDWMQSRLNLGIPYEVIETTRHEWEFGGPNLQDGSIQFFTDGSKVRDKTGAGITGPGLKISVSMGQWTTVFLAEIFAILECTARCLKRNYRHAIICIFSDSQAALKALNSFTCQSRLVWECIVNLRKLCIKNKVRLYWVPGHCGVEGNEQADTLARQGSSELPIGPEPFCGVSICVQKMEIKKWEEHKIQSNWIAEQQLRQSKLFIIPNKRRSERILSLNKKSLYIYIGLITGHCPARYHLKKLKLVQNDVCRLCSSETETSKHLLCDCGALSAKRRLIFNKGTVGPNEIWSRNPAEIVDFILEVIPDWGTPHYQSVTVISNGNRAP